MASYDVIIIGGGPGGYVAAERLGASKKRVLLVERDALGGTCLNTGCIPTKTLLHSAKLYAHALEAEKYGVAISGARYDWRKMQAWKRETVEKLRGGLAQTEKNLGVEVLAAEARLLGPGKIEVRPPGGARQAHDATSIIVATGSVPLMPPIPGSRDNPKVVDSTGILELEEVPKRLCVIGGGVIGVEFAGLFSALGCSVEVIEMMDEILPFMDKEQAPLLRRAMKGVSFRIGCRVERIEGGTVFYRTKDDTEARAEADLVLMSVGRKPAIDGWGAVEAGLDCGPKGIVVDERMRTNLPGIWAVGDVTGGCLLAHAAYRMADIAAADILSSQAAPRDSGASRGVSAGIMRYEAIPWAVYGITEAAGVGLTEQDAEARGVAILKASVSLKVSGRFCAESGFAAPGAVKVLADRGSGRILGVHVVGAYASEMIWGGAVLLEQELRVKDAKEVIFPHPTVSEAIRDAVFMLEERCNA